MVDTFHIVIAMKPVEGTFAENALAYGVAGLNVDASRIVGDKGNGVWGTSNENCSPTFNDSKGKHEFRTQAVEVNGQIGRFPANVILDTSTAEFFPIVETSGTVKSGKPVVCRENQGRTYGKINEHSGFGYADSGRASRFFFIVKTKT